MKSSHSEIPPGSHSSFTLLSSSLGCRVGSWLYTLYDLAQVICLWALVFLILSPLSGRGILLPSPSHAVCLALPELTALYSMIPASLCTLLAPKRWNHPLIVFIFPTPCAQKLVEKRVLLLICLKGFF